MPSLYALPVPGLRRATTRPRGVETTAVSTHDGLTLATDVHRPDTGEAVPTILIRTPYGRTGITGVPMVVQARLLAARGYAVVLQDVRGRFDSEGTFRPMVDEVADAASTIDWILDQPWSNGELGAFGLSYLGGTAWAAAAAAPQHVKALAVGITYSAVGLPDPRGVLHLDTTIRWLRSLEAMERTDESVMSRLAQLVRYRMPDSQLADQLRHLPVIELDEKILGQRSEIWHTWAAHPDLDDEFWKSGDLREFAAAAPPTVHVSGWYDIFVDRQLADIERQLASSVVQRAVIGPWGHLAGQVQTRAFTEMLAHFDHHLLGLDRQEKAAHSLWVGGEDAYWLEVDRWPSPDRWLRLALGEDLRANRTTVVYDPDDPTPHSGGRTLAFDAGPVDCSSLQLREDVATLTTAPLPSSVTILGRPALRLRVDHDGPSTDVWVRLADVGTDGRSTSVSDGYHRLSPAPSEEFQVDLHPVGHTFAAGHRLRVFVAGGAFPHHDRNLGVPGDRVQLTQFRSTTVHLDRVALSLPVLTDLSGTRLSA